MVLFWIQTQLRSKVHWVVDFLAGAYKSSEIFCMKVTIINGYFDTSDNKLTQDMFCTDILASGNCNNIVKSYDGTVWNFFSDMRVDFQTKDKCIRITKDYTITSSLCTEPIHGVVCRLDCCKLWYFFWSKLIQFLIMCFKHFHSGCYLQLPNTFIFESYKSSWHNSRLQFENWTNLSIQPSQFGTWGP